MQEAAILCLLRFLHFICCSLNNCQDYNNHQYFQQSLLLFYILFLAALAKVKDSYIQPTVKILKRKNAPGIIRTNLKKGDGWWTNKWTNSFPGLPKSVCGCVVGCSTLNFLSRITFSFPWLQMDPGSESYASQIVINSHQPLEFRSLNQ